MRGFGFTALLVHMRVRMEGSSSSTGSWRLREIKDTNGRAFRRSEEPQLMQPSPHLHSVVAAAIALQHFGISDSQVLRLFWE